MGIDIFTYLPPPGILADEGNHLKMPNYDEACEVALTVILLLSFGT